MWLDQYKNKQLQTKSLETQDSLWVKDIYDELKKQEKLALDEETQNSLKDLKIDLSLELAYILEYGNWYLVEKWDTLSHINALLPEWFSLSVPDPKKLQSGKHIRVIVENWIVYVKRIITKDKEEIEIKEQISWSKIVWWSNEQSKAKYETYRLSRWASDCEMILDELNWKFIAENWELIIPIEEVKSLDDLRAKTQQYREKKADEKALTFISQLQDFDYNKDTNEFYSKDWKIVIPREQVKDFQELKDLIAVKVEELHNNQAQDFANRALIQYKQDSKQYFIPWFEVYIHRDIVKSLDDLLNIINIETEKYLNSQWKQFALQLWIEFDETKKAYIIPNMNATIVRDDVKSFEELKSKYDEIISRQSKSKLEFLDYSVKSWDWMIKIIINNWKDLWLENNSRKVVLEYYNNYKNDIVNSNNLKLAKNWDPIILVNSSLKLPVHGVSKTIKEPIVWPIQEIKPKEKFHELPKPVQIEVERYSIDPKSLSPIDEQPTNLNQTKVEVIHTQDQQKDSKVWEQLKSDSIIIEKEKSSPQLSQNQTPESLENKTIQVEQNDSIKLEDDNSSIFDLPNLGIFNTIKKYTIKQQEAIEWNVSIVVWHEDPSIKNKDKPRLAKPEQPQVIVPPKFDISHEQANKEKSWVKALLKRSDMKADEIQMEKVYSMRNLKHGFSLHQFYPDSVTKGLNDWLYMLTLDWANIDQYLDKDWNMLINVSKLVEHNQFDYSALTAWYVMLKIDWKVTLYRIKDITSSNDIIIWDKIEYFSQNEYEAYREIDTYHRFMSKYDSSLYSLLVDKVWLDEMLEKDLLNVKFLFDLFMKSTLRGDIFEQYLLKVVDILPDQLLNWKLNLSWEYYTESNLRELSRFGYNTKKKDMEVISFNNVKTSEYYRNNWIIPLCDPNILKHSLSILNSKGNHKWAITEYKWDVKLMISDIDFVLSKNQYKIKADHENNLSEFVLGLKSFTLDEKFSFDLVKWLIEWTLTPLDSTEQTILYTNMWHKTFSKEKEYYDKFIGLWIPEFNVKKVLSFANSIAKNEDQLNLFIMRILIQIVK